MVAVDAHAPVERRTPSPAPSLLQVRLLTLRAPDAHEAIAALTDAPPTSWPIIGGMSAGGGLAAGIALLARDRGGPALLGRMLLTPMLDDRDDTGSAWQMAGCGIWDRAANGTGWRALLGERQGAPDVSPYAAPARASDLSGLPPTLLDVGSAETFRDEASTYASRIWQVGGNAELHVWPGGYDGAAAPRAGISRGTIQARNDWLKRLLEV